MVDELEETRRLFGISPRSEAATPLETASMPTSQFLELLGETPEPTREFEVAPTPTFSREFTRGLGAGLQQLGTDVRAAAAVGLELFGLERDAAELSQIVQQRERETAAQFPRAIRRIEDIESIGDFTLWASRTLGEQVPVLGSMLLAGGGGAVLGRLIGKGALSFGAAQSLATRFPSLGATVGVVGAASTIETGATATELLGATGELHPEASLIAGVTKGLLEAAVPAFLGSRFGLTADITGSILRRVVARVERVLPTRLSTAVGAGFGEALTESLQETVDLVARDYVDENFALLDEGTRSRILNAAASGGLVGALLGGAAGRGRVKSVIEELPPETPVSIGSLPSGIYLDEGTIAESTDFPVQQPIGPSTPTELEDLGNRYIFIPQTPVKVEGFELAPQTLTTPDGRVVTVFERPEIAQRRAALVSDVRDLAIESLSVDARNAFDISVDIRDLPSIVNEQTPGVIFLDPSRKDEAIAHVRKALSERRAKGREIQSGQEQAGTLADVYGVARDIYLRALDAGFRLRPKGSEGYVIISQDEIIGERVGLEALSMPPEDVLGNTVVDLDNIQRPIQGGATVFKPLEVSAVMTPGRGAVFNFNALDEAVTPHGIEKLELSTDLSKLGPVNARNVEAELRDKTPYEVASTADREGLARQLNILRDPSKDISQQHIDDLILLGLRRPVDKELGPTHYIVEANISPDLLEEVPGSPDTHRRRTTIGNFHEGNVLQTLQGLVDAGLAFDGIDGGAFPLKAQQPGTAHFLVKDTLEPRIRRNMHKIVRFYNAMMERYGLKDEKLIVFTGNLDTFSNTNLFDVSRKMGHYAATDGSTHIIGLNTELSDADLFSTAMHEFGHFLVQRRLASTDSGLLQKIFGAYNRALIRAHFGDAREFQRAFLELTALDREFDSDLPIRHLLGKGRLDYYLSFDEFVARQVAKYFESHAVQQMNSADSFFRSVASQLRTLYEYAVRRFRMRAEPEIEEWIEHLAQHPNSNMQAARTESENRGQQENAVILRAVSNGEHIPPPQAATHNSGLLMEKLGLPKRKVREIRAFTDKFNWFIDLFYNLQQIAQLNPHLKPLNRYVELVDQWYNFQMRWISRANDRVRAWMHIGNQQQVALSKFIFAIDQMEYLSQAERDEGVVRQPTNEELEAFARKFKLEPVSYELFLEIRDDFAAVLDQIEETSIRDIQRTISDPAMQTLRIASVRDDMDRLRSRPYFPHSRFGDIALVVKDESGKTLYMEQFATAKAAERAAPDIQREFPEAKIRIDKIPEEVRVFRGLPSSLLSNIRTKLNLTETQERWLDDFIVEMSPSASFRRRLQKRANVPGFSLDAMRSYASYFFSGAKHLARIEFRPLMDEEIRDFSESISNEAIAGEITDVRTRRRIQDYMANHLEHIMNPKPDWAQLRSIAFQWYLGFNVSSAVLNFTQPVLVGWPYLAARFGDGKSMQAMMKAVKDIQSMYKFEKRFGERKIDIGLFKAIDRAVKEGVVDESQATELAATAQGGYIQQLLPGSKSQRTLMQFARYSAWMFQQSERMNRRVMFRAAWDLAMKNPEQKYLFELEEQNELEMRELYQAGFTLTQARAYLAARDAVRRTQFQYAPHARPKFMRGKRGVLFAFFMFKQNMIHYTIHSPGHIRFLAMMLFMAGLMGLPGAEDLSELAKFAARNLLGKEFDLEKEVREFVTDLTDNPEVADLLLFGTGRVGFGLPALMDMVGLPKAEFDFSRRIGMGRVIPGIAELGPPGLDFDERMSRITTDTAGAAYGMGINIIRALQDDSLPIDDFKRWERAMPTSLRNISRAVRYLREERERTRTGATLIDYDLTDPDHIAETALVALGFAPTRQNRAWDEALMRKEVEAYWMARRAIILRTFDYSFVNGDAAARRQAWNDIRQYNASVPFGVMRLTTRDLRRSRKQRIKARRLFELGISRTRYLRPITNEIDRLFPRDDKPQEGEVTIENADFGRR